MQWKPRNFQWRPLLQKLMGRSSLSATTRAVNVEVEFPISCAIPLFFYFPSSFLSRRRIAVASPPPPPSIDEAFRVDVPSNAIKWNVRRWKRMMAMVWGENERAGMNGRANRDALASVRPAFDAAVKCAASVLLCLAETTVVQQLSNLLPQRSARSTTT